MNIISNPYIGPRTFKEDERDRFHGREREADELLARVLSEQEIVFYAQSGAGKSSLVNTCLIPALREEGIEVLLGRVSGDAPAGLEVDNIFVFNLLRSLSASDVNVNTLAKQSLNDFLTPKADDSAASEGRSSKRRALIIDQFEEIFSTHPEAWEKRTSFFKQLAKALKTNPRLRVVLVMREDFIASLDPHARILPGKLQMRYYMQRLERNAALKAVTEPVKDTGRPYADGVAEKVIEDLCRVTVYGLDGKPDRQPGQYVEPVQLQVVCYNLWEHLSEGGKEITSQDLQDVGDVRVSLGNYYAARVKTVAAEAQNVSERKIRAWFADKLIAPNGIRNMVLHDPGGESGGLKNEVIQALSDLVRAETRGNATFYELTHDSLVEPILTNNRKWEENRSSLLRTPIALWNEHKQDDDWLLADQALAPAVQWEKEHPDELTDEERKFLEKCKAKQKEREAKRESEAKQQQLETTQRRLELTQKLMDEQARSARRGRQFLVVALALMVISITASFFAFAGSNEAIQQQQTAEVAKQEAEDASILAGWQRATAIAAADIARSRELASAALNQLDSRTDLAILLGIESYRANPNPQTQNAILTILQKSSLLQGFLYHADNAMLSPDGKTLASLDKAGITLWDAQTHQKLGGPFNGHFGGGGATALSPDGKILASGGEDGSIILWDLKTQQMLSQPITGHSEWIIRMAFSPDGKTLASDSTDGSVILWDVTDRKNPRKIGDSLVADHGAVFGLAFSPDGKTLASGNEDGTITLWAMNLPRNAIHTSISMSDRSIYALAFSPNGTLASGSDDGSIILWDVNPEKPKQIGDSLMADSGVYGLAFSSNGKMLASATDSGAITLWSATESSGKNFKMIGDPLTGHSGLVFSLVFSPDNKTLVSSSFDGTIILWDITSPGYSPIGEPITGSSSEILSVSVDSTGKTLVAGSFDGSITAWDISILKDPQMIGAPFKGHPGLVTSMSFSPDGNTLISNGEDGTILLNVKTHELIGPVEFKDESRDGNVLVYEITDPKSGSKSIKLFDTTTGKTIGAPIAGSFLEMDSNGQILVYRTDENGKSILNLLNIKTKKTISEALAEDLGDFIRLSENGATLAYTTRDSEGNQTINFLAAATGAEISRPVRGEYEYTALSPDGEKLFYKQPASDPDNPVIDIWDIPNRTAFISKSIEGTYKTISPDGRVMLYETTEGSTSSLHLYDMQKKKLIGDSIPGEYLPSDMKGTKFVYQVHVEKTNENRVHLLDTSTEDLSGTSTWQASGEFVALTQDGNTLVYKTVDASGSGISFLDTNSYASKGETIKGEFLSVNADGTTVLVRNGDVIEMRTITETIAPGSNKIEGDVPENIQTAALSPDGKTLAVFNSEDILLQNISNGDAIGKPYNHHIGVDIPGSTAAFSPDGRTLAIGNSNTETTTLWNLKAQEQIGEELPGYWPIFSPGGETLAIGDNNAHTTQLWDSETWQPIGDNLPGEYLSFSPDGQALAIGNLEKSTTSLWDLATLKQIGDTLPGEWPTFSPDGKTLAIGNFEKTNTTLWDWGSKEQVSEFTGDLPDFSPGGKILAIGNFGDSTTRLWNLATQQPIGNDLPGAYPSFSPDGKTLAIGDPDTSTTTLWDMQTREQIGDELAGEWPTFSQDGKILAIGSFNNSTTTLWDLDPQSRTLSRHLVGSTKGQVTSLTFSPDGKLLASIGEDGIILSDVSTQAKIGDLLAGKSPVFSPDSKVLAVSDDEKSTSFWDTTTGDQIGGISGIKPVFSKDGQIIATFDSKTNEIALWNFISPEKISKEKSISIPGNDVLFSPDGKLAAIINSIPPPTDTETNTTQPTSTPTANTQGTQTFSIMLWDIKKMPPVKLVMDEILLKENCSSDQPNCVKAAFSPDGKYLAYNDGGQLFLWDTVDHKLRSDSISVSSPLKSIIFATSHNLQFLIIGDNNGFTTFYDLSSLSPFGNSTQGYIQLDGSYSNKDTFLISNDGNLSILNFDPDKWVDQLCLKVSRNLTRDEWRQSGFSEPYPTNQDDATCPQWPVEPEVVATPTP